MRGIGPFLATLIASLAAAAPAVADYWKLSGPPAFETDVNGIKAFHQGETRPTSDGEGGQITLVSRTFTSAAFLSLSSRWGAHRMTFSWVAPPDVIRPGEKFTTKIGWSIASKWTQFSPRMLAFSNLDWSDGFYVRSLQYGYGRPDDLKDFAGFDSHVWTVTTNNSAKLKFYSHADCSGAWVRVIWTYDRVSGSAPTTADVGANGSLPQSDTADAPTPPDTDDVSGPTGAVADEGQFSDWRPPVGATGAEALTAPPEPVVFRNGADGSVSPGATQPASLEVKAGMLLTQIMTYHYGARGRPGTIALRHADGTIYGPWQAAGAGSAATPNVYWWARPNVALKPGHYTVVDSDPASWSTEAATQGAGIVQIWGRRL